MERSRFTEDQVIGILKRHEAEISAADLCCKHGVSENLSLIADTSTSGARVARELDALVTIYGKPACIVSDNRTVFTSKANLK